MVKLNIETEKLIFRVQILNKQNYVFSLIWIKKKIITGNYFFSSNIRCQLVHILTFLKSVYVFKWICAVNVEKAMATHYSALAQRLPWMEELRLQSIGSWRVGHDWATLLSPFTFMHRRRKWQPTPVFLPGESQGRGSLVGCCLWGRTEAGTTEVT